MNNYIYILLEKKERRCCIMTMATTNHFCTANKNDIGFFDGVGVFPRSIREKKYF